MRLLVRLGHVVKYPLLIALSNICFTVLKSVIWCHWSKYGFVILAMRLLAY